MRTKFYESGWHVALASGADTVPGGSASVENGIGPTHQGVSRKPEGWLRHVWQHLLDAAFIEQPCGKPLVKIERGSSPNNEDRGGAWFHAVVRSVTAKTCSLSDQTAALPAFVVP